MPMGGHLGAVARHVDQPSVTRIEGRIHAQRL
jgi:hypothetical protein